MGPEVAALAFAAAATSTAAVGYFSERSAAKNQFKIDEAGIELRREQARLQAAETASSSALNFRKALASQVALASFRGGSGSLVRQFGAESYSNFAQDQAAIKRGERLIDVRAKNEYAQAAANKKARTLGAATKAIGTSLNSFNFNQIYGK